MIKNSNRILGISAFYHDSAAALIDDGRVAAAVQEERFSRIKHDESFPEQAIKWILSNAGIGMQHVDFVVFYEKPFLRFERLLQTYLSVAPSGFNSFRHSIPKWLKDKLFQKGKIIKQLRSMPGGNDWNGKLLFSDHHLSHAASAFYPSPFQDAAILTADGVGEHTTTSISIGSGGAIISSQELTFPHSLGLLYSTLTSFLGFKVNSGEYKVMGLAPYGKPIYAEMMLDELLDLKDDGSFRLNMRYFSFATDVKMASKKMETLFGISPRQPEAKLTQTHKDIAASLQSVTETVLLSLARYVATSTQQKNLCLAGGVALNCVANYKLLQSGLFENIWVQPAAGDAGGAIGAALAVFHLNMQQPRIVKQSYNTCLGPEYSNSEIEQQLIAAKARFSILQTGDLLSQVAELLYQGKIVGWMQGQAEFGPRALGNRSILANPQIAGLQTNLNLKIKFRESFRPFAPAILEEEVSDWFDEKTESTYMGFVAKVREVARSQIPAVTHLDGTARLQTVKPEDNPLFYKLLRQFYQLSECPILVNTSFNVRGEPLVLSPKHAYECFMGTGIDVLVIGNYILYKEEQIQQTDSSYVQKFVLD